VSDHRITGLDPEPVHVQSLWGSIDQEGSEILIGRAMAFKSGFFTTPLKNGTLGQARCVLRATVKIDEWLIDIKGRFAG
jgi:hypothetical protein